MNRVSIETLDEVGQLADLFLHLPNAVLDDSKASRSVFIAADERLTDGGSSPATQYG